MRTKRAASETREALLGAARIAFTTHGFDQVGLREITASAGVSASLINRYFGSKEQLFAETLKATLRFECIGGDSDHGLLSALAAFAMARTMDRNEFDPIMLVLRSAPIEKAQPVLREFLARQAIEPLAARLGGEGAYERASLIVSVLLGVIILRGVIKSEPLASSKRNDLSALVERIIATAADLDPALE